jgi:hypothetical protein
MLQCHVKGCSKDNFPLKLEEVEVEKEEQEFNPDFIRHMLPKIEWNALRGTAHSVCESHDARVVYNMAFSGNVSLRASCEILNVFINS